MFLNVEETLAKTTDGSTNDTNKKGYNFGFIFVYVGFTMSTI
jgi:hypothetical protein